MVLSTLAFRLWLAWKIGGGYLLLVTNRVNRVCPRHLCAGLCLYGFGWAGVCSLVLRIECGCGRGHAERPHQPKSKRVGRLRKPSHGMASAQTVVLVRQRAQNVCVLLYRPAASVVGWVFLSSVLCSLDFGMHIFRSRFFVD